MKLNTITQFSANENVNSPTLVFLHGNSMKAEFFKNLMDCKQLTNYSSIAIDLPGHGNSQKLDNYSITTLLNSLETEIKSFNSVIIVGHSLGGHLAIQLLSRIGELCKGIILIGTPPLKLPLNVDQAYNINDDSAALLKKDLSDAEISALTKLVYNEEDSVKNRIFTSFKKTDGQFRQDFALSLVNGDIQDEVELLRQFEGKKLLVAGTNDSVLNLNYLRELETDTLLESEFVFLENKGHCPHIEEPVKVASLIKKFVG